jgi:prepilin-type N-terminal cleavage/methylation domain-containing protein
MGRSEGGFTLIEISIVLVIIGLVVGGVLVGQDLIRAAAVRAQIAQIDRYQAAVNTFRGKYNAIPGDMNPAIAAQFGFTSRSGNSGQGDGDSLVQGGYGVDYGEAAMFWVDLSAAQLIDGGFISGSFTSCPSSVSSTALGQYLPVAKLGGGNYVYVWSGGYGWMGMTEAASFYGLEVIASTDSSCRIGNAPPSIFGISADESYAMDKKADDGFPQSGKIQAVRMYSNVIGYVMGDGGAADTTTATPVTSTSCYDDGGSTGSTRKYSVSGSGHNSHNCALSVQFQ